LKNSFNFGPIARTDAGGMHDTINLVSLPLHVMLNALVGSTSTDEFIAWLWHDLYKPAFQWVSTGKKDKDGNDKLGWYHTPGRGAFSSAEKTFAATTGIGTGLVSTHHDNKPNFTFHESDFISDQGDQVNLGAIVNYIQLSIASEPALPTVLARSVIANAFIEVVAKDVAESLRKGFIKDGRTPIDRVQFEFKTTSAITFSLQPTDKEIWDRVGQHFDVIPNRTFIIRHLTPVTKPEHEQFATTFTADLTGEPLLPDETLKNTVSLAELLVLYQDSRTVIIAVPQSQWYILDPKKIKQTTLETARKRLDDFNVLTIENGVDYLKIAFDTQVDIREVLGRQPKRTKAGRPLDKEVLHPSDLLAQARKSPSGKVCRLTGTPFATDLIPTTTGLYETRLDKLFSPSFVDTEFVGINGSIAPLTYLYILNSPNSGGAGKKGVSKRTALRGAFAFLAPASHFAIGEQGVKAVEMPPLDKGGRFSNQLNRITVTTQEFTLFQQMSRHLIANLWQKIAPNEQLPLPYLGAILLTHDSAQRIRELLPQLDTLFSEVSLKAYPFEIEVQPALEVALEIAVQDPKHASKHTLLKISPRIITAGPNSSTPLLVDDDIQVDVSKALFDKVQDLTEVATALKRRKKKTRQKEVWLKLILSGSDPLTAVFESAQATTDTRKLPEGFSLDTVAFQDAENFWDKYIDQGDIAQSWAQYEKLNKKTTTALEEFPALPLLMQALQKSNEEGTTDDPTAT
jgi:hypothetical protein